MNTSESIGFKRGMHLRFAGWGAFFLLVFSPVFAWADTHLVATGGTDSGDCTITQCLTVAYAITQATSGDTISVAAGSYSSAAALDPGAKNLIFQGAGLHGADMTRLIASSGANLFTIGTIGNTSTIRNFVLQGNGGGSSNGIIRSTVNASPTIEGNIFVLGTHGVSFTSASATPTVRNNIIIDRSTLSLGVSVANATASIMNNTVIHAGNSSPAFGGGNRMNNVAYTGGTGFATCTTHPATYNLAFGHTTGFDGTCTGSAGNISTSHPRFLYMDDSKALIQNASGTSTGLTATVLTDSTKGWATDEWAGYFVTPDIGNHPNPRYFLIVSNTSTALTVVGLVNMTNYGSSGGHYGITNFAFGDNAPGAGTGTAGGPATDIYGDTHGDDSMGAVKPQGTSQANNVTIYVTTTGADPMGDSDVCTSALTPCATVGYATELAQSGDTVSVAAGSYTLSAVIQLGAKNLTLLGAGIRGADLTRLVAANNSGVFNFATAGNTSSVRNFVLQGNGGVTATSIINSIEAVSLTIENNVFIAGNNAIRLTDAAVTSTVRNNIILERPTTSYGVVVGSTSTTVTNNTAVNSTSYGFAGGTRTNNVAYYGGTGFEDCTSHPATYNLSFGNTTNYGTNCAAGTGNVAVDPRILYQDDTPGTFIQNASGTSTGLSATVLTDGSKSWTVNQWAGYFVTPNVAKGNSYPQYFLILSNTSTALTVASSNSLTSYGASGNRYGITDFTFGTNSAGAGTGTAGGPATDIYGEAKDDDDMGAVKAQGTSITVPATFYVSSAGSDPISESTACASAITPCASANYAAALATSGDTVHLQAGSHTITSAIDPGGRNLTFEGAGILGANMTRLTQSSSSTLVFSFTVAGNTSTIKNLVIQGNGSSVGNAAIFSSVATNLTIEKNIIQPRNSNGIRMTNSSATNIIRNNLIVENAALWDGIVVAGNSTTITNNTMVNMLGTAMVGGARKNNIAYASNVGYDTCGGGSGDVTYSDAAALTTSFGTNCDAGNNSTSDPTFSDKDLSTSTNLAASVLTDGTKNWTVNQWAGYFVTPDTSDAKPQYFLIISNTATALTVSSLLNMTTYGSTGNTYRITDFTLKTASALRDIGTNTGAPSDDIYGMSRPQSTTTDMGATEYEIQPDITIDDPSVVETEAGQTMTFTVTLSKTYSQSVTVDYATSNNTATAGSDYTAITATTLTFTSGQTSKTFDVTIAGDTLDEANETFYADLSNASNGAVTDNQGIGTINDNDASPTVAWTSSSQSSAETNAATMTITAELSTVSGQNVSVPFTLTGTATGGSTDYSITASPVVITAGGTTTDITITIVGDTLDEVDETVIVTMGAPTNASQGATIEHTATITDNDATPSVQWTSSSQSSANETNAATMTVTAQLSTASGRNVTVPYTVNGSSTATGGGVDYTITASPLIITAGNTTGDVTVTIVGDSLDEASESVVIDIGSPTNATTGATTQHTASITDDDSSPTAQWSVSSQSSANENNASTMTITVQLSAASGRDDVSVDFGVTGTATGGGTDYTISAGTINIAEGETTADATITIVGDTLDEDDETVILTLSGGANISGLGGTTVHTATITDDDASPSVQWTSASQSSVGESGTLTVTAELSVVSGRNVTVPFTLGGTATSGGTDYSITATPVTITAGNTTTDITITIAGDALDENNETVIITLGAPTNASQGVTTGHIATITDDDSAPTVAWTSSSQSSGAESVTITVTAQLSTASGLNVTVPYTLTGTATGGGTDYNITASPVTITAGSTTTDITITVVDDALDENNETVIVTMDAPTNAGQGATTVHTATITDDDAPPTVQWTAASQSSADETNGSTLTLTAQLSATSGLNVTVPYSMTGAATGSGTDYSITAGPVTITAGSTTTDVTITIVGDALDEPNESVIVTIGAPTNASQGATTVHTATITDDDASPTVTWTAASQSSGGESATMTVTAQLSGISAQNVSVPFALTGTATGGGTDYSITATPVTITAGSTTTNVTITIAADTLDEADETVIVTMGAPTNGTQGATTVHTATITDDDAAPSVTLSSLASAINEDGGSTTVTATLSGASGLDVTVNLGFSGTATLTTQYTASASSMMIAAGGTTGTITVTSVADEVTETDRTILVDISSVTNGSESGTQQVVITRTEGAAEDEEEVVIAVAGSDVTITAGGMVTLDGSGSGSASNVDITYSWSLVTDRGSIASPATATPTYTAPASTTARNIEISLTVSSEEGTSSTDSLTVHVMPKAEDVQVSVLEDMLVTVLDGTPVYEETVSARGRQAVFLEIGAALIRLPDQTDDYTILSTPEGYLVIGVPHDLDGIGRVFFSTVPMSSLSGRMTLSTDTTSFTTAVGNRTGDYFGKYLALGDVDQDGVKEIFISAPGASDGGVLYVYDTNYDLMGNVFGTPSFPVASIMSADYVTSTDDDLLFGPDNAALNVRLGRQASLTASQRSSLGFVVSGSDVSHQSLNLETTSSEARLGAGDTYQSMAVGDVNDDGEADLVQVSSSGTIYIYFGKLPSSGDFTTNDVDVTITGGDSSYQFGRMLAVGDVTGDGVGDIVLGAPQYGSENTGGIYVIFGGATWEPVLDLTASDRFIVVPGASRSGGIGSDLLLADLDNDGNNEVYTVTGGSASAELTYEIIIADPDTLSSDDEAPPTRIGHFGGGGCSLIR